MQQTSFFCRDCESVNNCIIQSQIARALNSSKNDCKHYCKYRMYHMHKSLNVPCQFRNEVSQKTRRKLWNLIILQCKRSASLDAIMMQGTARFLCFPLRLRANVCEKVKQTDRTFLFYRLVNSCYDCYTFPGLPTTPFRPFSSVFNMLHRFA